MLSDSDRQHLDQGSLAFVLYADDTLLIGSSSERLQRLLRAVAVVGASYGLQLHADKFQLIQVRTTEAVHNHQDRPIAVSNSMTYLGTNIASSGTVVRELGQKLGAVWSIFKPLQSLWKHAQVSRARKIQVFQAVATSKLLYGLSSAWLNVAEQRRLNGFQARYLRAIFGIQPAYVSRVSNQRVLERARQQPYSQQLLKQQLLLFGKIARAPRTDSLRKLTVCHLSLRPAASTYVRRVGRPRSEWAAKLREHALRIASDAVIAHPATWRAAINVYFKI